MIFNDIFEKEYKKYKGLKVRRDESNLVIYEHKKHEKILKKMKKYSLTGLELNISFTWLDENLDLLKDFPFIEKLVIVYDKFSDDSIINELTSLKELSLGYIVKNSKIDFSRLTKLIDLKTDWSNKYSNIFEIKNLESLSLWNYNYNDLSIFKKLNNLKFLLLVKPKIKTLNGIKYLKKLQSLYLDTASYLENISELKHCKELNDLEINNTKKIYDIEVLSKLTNLIALELCNDEKINSIKPISKLNKLTHLWFYESTNILDGDLSPLLELKNLKSVTFQNRRHYSHSSTDILKYHNIL